VITTVVLKEEKRGVDDAEIVTANNKKKLDKLCNVMENKAFIFITFQVKSHFFSIEK
jgi:hypothetical protein